ncbi:MAG TPA: adenylate/guanylate cyclase domain-containing protein [Caulobacterales bacterium]|nr:adenylate/guanylate cyclase domain-containing protein [Caulobacterales bacterium]
MVEQRKLATIMAVDVAGYSRAAEFDDSAAAEAVGALRRTIGEVIAPFGGRIFNTAGDGFMIEFPAASSGAQAALRLLAESKAGVRPLPRIRIGLHLGEVIVGENGDLLGHGVNVAARLQALAAPGGAMVSQAVQAQLRKAAGIPLSPRGRVQLDKMSERVEVFALAPGQRAGLLGHWRDLVTPPFVALALVTLGLAGWLVWRAIEPALGGPPEQAPSQRIAFFGFTPAGQDPLAGDIAASATNETFQALLALRLEAASRAETQGVALAQQPARAAELGAAYALGGEVRRTDSAISIQMHLEDVASRTTLWEQTVNGSANEKASLPVLAAGAATRVARCMAGARPGLQHPDGDLLAQLATACATPFLSYREATAQWRALAQRAPNSAVIQANLGNSLLYYANHANLTPADTPQVWREAETVARRALVIEPDNGVARTVLAYDAIFKGRPLAEAGRLMDAAVRDSPDDWRRGETYSNQNEVLQGMGRSADSVAGAQAATERDPLSPTPSFQLALALVRIGRGPEAGRVWQQLNARWPDAWWETWAMYSVRDGISDIETVLAAAPSGVSEDSKTCWRRLARASASRNAAVRRAGAAVAVQCGSDARIDAYTADLMRMHLLGDAESTFTKYATFLDHRYPSNFLWNAGEFFTRSERALRANPRFLPLMKQHGIYQYWLDTGTHPDVCDLPEERNLEVCASLRADQARRR